MLHGQRCLTLCPCSGLRYRVGTQGTSERRPLRTLRLIPCIVYRIMYKQGQLRHPPSTGHMLFATDPLGQIGHSLTTVSISRCHVCSPFKTTTPLGPFTPDPPNEAQVYNQTEHQESRGPRRQPRNAWRGGTVKAMGGGRTTHYVLVDRVRCIDECFDDEAGVPMVGGVSVVPADGLRIRRMAIHRETRVTHHQTQVPRKLRR